MILYIFSIFSQSCIVKFRDLECKDSLLTGIELVFLGIQKALCIQGANIIYPEQYLTDRATSKSVHGRH